MYLSINATTSKRQLNVADDLISVSIPNWIIINASVEDLCWFVAFVYACLCMLAINSPTVQNEATKAVIKLDALSLYYYQLLRIGSQSVVKCVLKASTWVVEKLRRYGNRVLSMWNACFSPRTPSQSDKLKWLKIVVLSSVAGGGLLVVMCFLGWLVFGLSGYYQTLLLRFWMDDWMMILTGGAMLVTGAYAWVRYK